MPRGVDIVLRLLNRGFNRRAGESTRKLNGIGAAARKMGGRVATAADRTMDRLSTAGAAAAGVGLGVAIRDYQQLELRMTRVALTARRDATEVDRLNNKLLQLSGAPTGQLAGDLLTAVEELIALDVDWEEVLGSDILERLGRTATATGADIGDLARLAYTLQNAYGMSMNEVATGLEMLASAGKRGAFLFKDMAAEMPQIAAVMSQIGEKGVDGLARTASMMQMVRRETGSSQVAATNLVNALSYIQGAEFGRKAKDMGTGLEVFDDEGKMRDVFAILEDIVQVTEKGANQKLLAQLFSDRQAREGMTALVKHWDDMHGLIGILHSDLGVIDKDFEAVAATGSQQWKELRAEIQKLAHMSLGPWAAQLTGVVKTLNDNPYLLEDFAKVAVLLGGAKLGQRGIWGLVGGAKGLKGGVGAGLKGAASAAGAQPVYVTNWPAGGLGGGAGAGQGGKGKLPGAGGAGAGAAGSAVGAGGTAAALLGFGAGGVAHGMASREVGKRLWGIDPSEKLADYYTVLAALAGVGWAQQEREIKKPSTAQSGTGAADLMTALLSWMGVDWAQQYRGDKRHDQLRIELDVTAPDGYLVSAQVAEEVSRG